MVVIWLGGNGLHWGDNQEFNLRQDIPAARVVLGSGVPMVLFPQHSEERAVAIRAEQLGAGVMLKRPNSRGIRKAIEKVLDDASYRESAMRMRKEFLACGGEREAADFIESRMK